MAEILCDVLKKQVDELFSDLLTLEQLTVRQKNVLTFVKLLVDKTSSKMIMELLSEDLVNADIDHLENNGQAFFEYIFSVAGKRNISQSLVKEMIEDLYIKLSSKDKETITEYARYMKRVCERWQTNTVR